MQRRFEGIRIIDIMHERPGLSRPLTISEALAGPPLATRGLVHGFDAAWRVRGPFRAPVAAFGLPDIDAPPGKFVTATDAVLAELR